MWDRQERENLTDWIYVKADGYVQSGPFRGMKLLRNEAWKDGGLAPKLLGTYEEELHFTIEGEIARLAALPAPIVVNVGCGEGYYAVGMARRLPNATVAAIDCSTDCIQIAAATADANGVKLAIGAPIDLVFEKVDLAIVDCEGAEVGYLDLDKFPALKSTTIIVEVHNFSDKQDTHGILLERFKYTHDIDWVLEGARNPNKHALFWDQPSNIRWEAVNEHRPCVMYWFVMRPFDIPKAKPGEVPSVRACGECNLCCKVERVPELHKEPNSWCPHCEIKKGCSIYEMRPNICREFKCLWLIDPNMPEELWPYKVNCYAVGNTTNDYIRVVGDKDTVTQAELDAVTKYVASKGKHVIVHTGRQITFVAGEGVAIPAKLQLDWTL